jgi:hypothetical protein
MKIAFVTNESVEPRSTRSSMSIWIRNVAARASLLLNWLKMVFIRFSGFGGSFEAHTCF